MLITEAQKHRGNPPSSLEPISPKLGWSFERGSSDQQRARAFQPHENVTQGSKKAPARAGVRSSGCAPTGPRTAERALGKRHSLQPATWNGMAVCNWKCWKIGGDIDGSRHGLASASEGTYKHQRRLSFFSLLLCARLSPAALHRPIVQFGRCQASLDGP